MSPETHHAPACGYDVTHVWEREGSFSVRRLVRDRGIVPIPHSLPGYRAALSLVQNQAWLAVGKRVITAGSFAPGANVLGQRSMVRCAIGLMCCCFSWTALCRRTIREPRLAWQSC
jgi:hypothetical protein